MTIAGDGTQQDWLVEIARKHKVLKAVRFAGRADHDKLLELLHRADAAVLPSHYGALRHRGAGGRRRHSPGDHQRRRSGRGRDRQQKDRTVLPPRDVPALAAAVRAVLDDPAAAQRRAVAAREP